MGAEDLAYIEDSIHRAVQRKTSPRWDQDVHSLEHISEKQLGVNFPFMGRKLWHVSSLVGSDVTGNGSEAKPYATLSKAHTEMGTKDTIIVDGGFLAGLTITKSFVRILGMGWQHSGFLMTGAVKAFIASTVGSLEIAGFRIEMDDIGTPAFDISAVSDLWIHHNMIIGPMSEGIKVAATTPGSRQIFEHNRIYGATNEGIKITGAAAQTPVYEVVRDNYIVNCGEGIELIGGAGGNLLDCIVENNKIWAPTTYGIVQSGTVARSMICGNTIVKAGTAPFSGALGYFIDNKFSHITAGNHTTTGVAEEIIFTDIAIQPMTRVHGYLRLNSMIAGDTFIFRVKKSNDGGVAWDIIDETTLIGAQVIARYDYDLILEDAAEQARVTVQRVGAVDRAFRHKRTVADK